ncbi:hypothetical protein SZ64_06270 [Erythrobacter sp. SG61-1L]|uniref:nuclear transport factor 2 family protein n=1 Tax=Erythrobacter sp. SG61-1L TaxID=1603897 RepID=UPI0006C8F5A9|nr:nuclear transport factor 2 family protein [Erythrobacter sp. SG61-1L]KPL67755.1 hypothetical protein SZ64_06270 [Erythrobacter sp. SG61-1L]
MKFQLLGAIAALSITGAAQAADLTPTEIVNRHVSSGGNVDAIMADYADDAVVLQQGRAFQGKDAIRGLFENMFKRPAGPAPSAPPAGGANGGGAPKMNVTRVWEEGNVGFMTWEMGPMKATEEFIVRDGKIQVQTIFMSGPPAGGPAPQ